MKVIENYVKQAIKANTMFTSVDIANRIKKAGVWVRNRDVADFLRGYDFPDNYERTTIDVTVMDNGSSYVTGATLYYPDFTDPDNYTETAQEAVNKDTYDTSSTAVIAQAIRDGKRVFFEYKGSSDSLATTREVDPWLVAMRANGVAYLIGYQHEGGTDASIRQYIVSKLDDVRIVDEGITEIPTEPADPSKWMYIIEQYDLGQDDGVEDESDDAESDNAYAARLLTESMQKIHDAVADARDVLDKIKSRAGS